MSSETIFLLNLTTLSVLLYFLYHFNHPFDHCALTSAMYLFQVTYFSTVFSQDFIELHDVSLIFKNEEIISAGN